MFAAFGEFWKRYIDFQGRTGRKTFWLTILAEYLLLVLVIVPLRLLFPDWGETPLPAVLLSFILVALMIPTAALMVRRLRDAGYGWGWVFLFFLYGIGWIVLIILHTRPTAEKWQTPPVQAPARPVQAPARPVQAQPAPVMAQTPARPAPKSAPAPAPARKEYDGVFYVFAVQGPAFGNPEGDMVREKAEALRDSYPELSKNKELRIVYPHQWGGKVESSSGAGMISYSVSFEACRTAIRRYLLDKGLDESSVEEAVSVANEKRPMITNPFSGVTVIGVPVTNRKTAPAVDYKALADKLAHHASLMYDDPEQKEMQEQLLAGGEAAQKAITDFLLLCSTGFVASGWWSRASLLVRLIRQIGGEHTEERLRQLTAKQTNIWEYHTQIIDVAEKELLALKTEQGGFPDGIVPREYAHAKLLELQNVNPPEKRLEEYFALKSSEKNWSHEDCAFYYFIAGGAARVLFPYNNASLAFYAAQVLEQPNPNSLGWKYLKEKEGDDLQTTPTEALRLSKKYPLPATMQEAMAYPY